MLRQYRIEAQLNSGGTGTVYRARDTQLERAVAIRILPDASPQAKSASTLSHRNIVAIYDVDDIEVDGQPVHFIAMEYVPGKTLGQLIGRKGLRLRAALGYAVQIAEGLAVAHEAGIVHGNLSSANVIINKPGEAKILDFGLAKQGDESTDIFSFGRMLRQMISGDRAADLPNSARHEIPRQLERIIARCLDENPQRRWQSMEDVRAELDDVLAGLASLNESGVASTAKRRWGLAFSLVLLVLALAGGTYLGAHRPNPQPTFQRLTFRRGNIAGARFSPDGTVLFSAQWATDPTTTFSARPGMAEARSLGLPAGRILSISSLGEMAMLIGSSARGIPGTLARLSASGGTPRELLENVYDADWSSDGSRLAVSHTVAGRNRIEYPIGTVLDEIEGRPPYTLRVSPNGDSLAFFRYDNAVGDFSVVMFDRNRNKRVLSRGWRAEGRLAWSPKGDEIWFSANRTEGQPALHAVKTNGEERVIVEAPAWLVLQDISGDGRVLATVEDARVGILGLAPGAKQERDLSWFEASRIYDISTDGKMILFVELFYGTLRNAAIYLRRTDGTQSVRLGEGNRPALSPDGKWVVCIVSDGAQTRLTLLPTSAGEARTVGASGMHYERVEWFPDGRRILFEGNQPNRPLRTFVQDLNGGKPVPLTPEGLDATRVSPDQRYVTAVSEGKLSLFPISGNEPKVITTLETGESVVSWSGEGRYLFLKKLAAPAVLNIYRLDVATGRRDLWKELKTPDPVGVQIGQVVMTPDGNSYAYSFQRDISNLFLIEGLR